MFLRPNSALKQTPPSSWYYHQINLAAGAMDSCFVLIKTHQYGTAPGERFLLQSIAATARIIWLCASVRYWQYREVDSVCFCAEYGHVYKASTFLNNCKLLDFLVFWDKDEKT
ncbi:unnamed protein product [Porites evermanni]|uniref:Uncharacterized protein n=1 Tax=Porites evermanni TaxID=104178 RepID=A0ABN8SZ02_9CNID|nr:unnamed protein product [Porites evermanni]